jgi:hypothetical protein
MTVSVHRTHHVNGFRGAINHSPLTSVSLFWSAGQGVRPLPGQTGGHGWGLYLSASVKSGHTMQIDGIKLNKSTRTLTITADARGIGAAGKTSRKQEQHIQGSFGMKPQKWTVVVKNDFYKVVAKKTLMLGGPPAP